MPPNLENSAVATGKRSVFIPIPKKSNAKECSNCHTIALISHASKVMLKILQVRLQQYVNRELPDVRRNALNFSLLKIMFAEGLSYIAFIMLRYVPSSV